jgi:hypothetical protein
MVSLVLSVAVLVSSGGLLAERVPAPGMLIGAVNLNGASALYDNMTIEELTAQRALVEESMPSLGLGIALTAIGGGVLLTGLVIISSGVFILELVLVGLVVMAASIPLLIIGPILIARAARERRDAQTQLRLIDQRIASIRRDESSPRLPLPPPYEPSNEQPPPPPMRPPGSEFAPSVAPSLLLASF